MTSHSFRALPSRKFRELLLRALFLLKDFSLFEKMFHNLPKRKIQRLRSGERVGWVVGLFFHYLSIECASECSCWNHMLFLSFLKGSCNNRGSTFCWNFRQISAFKRSTSKQNIRFSLTIRAHILKRRCCC